MSDEAVHYMESTSRLREQLQAALEVVDRAVDQRDRLGAENEELREQLRQAEERASDADADWRACYEALKVAEDMREYAKDPAPASAVADWADRLDPPHRRSKEDE